MKMICLFTLLFSLSKLTEPNPKIAFTIQIGSNATPKKIELNLNS